MEQINRDILRGLRNLSFSIPKEENKNAIPKNIPQPKYSIIVIIDGFLPN